MKKIPKKAKIFVGVAVLAGAVGFGCFRVYQDHFHGTVAVYSASDGSISTNETDWGGFQYDGTIQADGMQTIMVSESQTVGEVAVKEGQQVKKGDKLFSYDTTLSDLDMQRAQLDIKKLELQLKTAKNNLKIVQKYRPGEPVKEQITQIDPVESSDADDDKDAGSKAANTSASNTMAKVVLLGGDSQPVQSFEDSDGSVTKDKTDSKTPSQRQQGGTTDTPAVPSENIPEDDNGETTYTKQEIEQMIAEQRESVRDLDLQLRQAKLQYTKKQKEEQNNTVYSELDGTVTYVGDPSNKSKAFMKISGGGGLLVKISVNEFMLQEVKVGQSATVQDWMTGESYTGKVKSISTYPSDEREYTGNPNSSYYPVYIQLDDSGNLTDQSAVGVALQTAEDQSDLYLESGFILKENGKNYVYVQGEDGKLEKRQVTIGKSLDGYYTQIQSGLTGDDWIAFPYGKNIKEGAATQQADTSELWQ